MALQRGVDGGEVQRQGPSIRSEAGGLKDSETVKDGLTNRGGAAQGA